MKLCLLILFLLLPASVAIAQEPSPTPAPSPDVVSTAKPNASNPTDYIPPTAEVRRKRFINSMVGPLSLGRSVARAGISTWKNSPEEWGTKWEGFGRRLASAFGKKAIKQTTIFGLDEAF